MTDKWWTVALDKAKSAYESAHPGLAWDDLHEIAQNIWVGQTARRFAQAEQNVVTFDFTPSPELIEKLKEIERASSPTLDQLRKIRVD